MLPHANDNATTQQENDDVRAKKREEYLDRIASAVTASSMKPVSDESVVKIVSSFSKTLKENNTVLLQTLIKEDKDLLTDTVKSFADLQGKTSKEFADKLDTALKFAEKLILRGETTNNPALKKTGEELKEKMYSEKFKAMGIDDDPTLGQRVRRRFFGENGEKNLGWVQGRSIFKNAGSALANSFSSQFMGGAFQGVSKTNEQRRAEVREQTDRENKKIAFLEESQQGLMGAINNSGLSPNEDTVTRGGGEEKTQLGSANIAPDTRTKSDIEELRAGIRDTDKAFARSSTLDADQKDENHWKELLKLLEDIKECVCECQCSGGPGSGLPSMIPTALGVGTLTTAAAATGAITSVGVPEVARIAASEQKTLALPKPVETTTTATKALPSPESVGRNPTLDELGLKQTAKEKVPVRATAEPVYRAKEISVAERFSRGEIGRDEAKRLMKDQASGKTVGSSEPVARHPDSRRPGETTDEWKQRKTAQMGEDRIIRENIAAEQNAKFEQAKAGSANTALATTPQAEAPWYKRAWESTKSTVSDVAKGTAERVKSVGSSALGAARTAGSWIQGQRAKGAEALGKGFDWVKGKAGKVFGGVAESVGSSRLGKMAAPAIKAAGGIGRVLGKAVPFLPAAIGAYSKYKETKARTGSTGRALLSAGITGLSTFGGQVLGEAGGAAVGSLAGPVGTGVGFVAGGAAGAYGGEKAGSWLSDKVDNLFWGSSERPAVATATRAGARQAPKAVIQSKPRATVQSGQNQDSAIISRSTAAVATARGVAEKPVINVPPPTVIQAPANNPTQLLPSTARSSRPEDSSWMQWQRKRASAMA